MNEMLALFIATLNVTVPVFAMVFLGLALKRIGWIDDTFIGTASTLVFKGTMPALVFLSIVRADLDHALRPSMLVFFACATLITFLLLWGWAIWRIPRAERGVIVQGAFRGNCGIVGLALAANLYGDLGLSMGGILMGVVILSYNILSVVVLSSYLEDGRTSWRAIAHGIITNPLILSVLAALPFAGFGWQLPVWLETSGDYFARMTLPLALICIGGTLSMRSLREGRTLSLQASLMKMISVPLIATGAAVLMGFRGTELGVLFFYFASPTAAASFVMVRAMGGNDRLAANIIAISTLMAAVTVTAGIFILKLSGLL
ncbi:AEC family transporter [Cobetia crustatorum]|uniref:AEC family transporter n=1 Tax=Cobetia crustatorum TaxID=553385 RepID=UPI00046A1B61|nr:AEC family transporter [Cobetia crustatorum]